MTLRLSAYQKVNARIEYYSSSDPSETKEELEQWQSELDKLRRMQPSVATVQQLKDKDIPALNKQLKEDSAKLADVQQQVEQVRISRCSKSDVADKSGSPKGKACEPRPANAEERRSHYDAYCW